MIILIRRNPINSSDNYSDTYRLRTGDYIVGMKKEILILPDGSKVCQELSYRANLIKPDRHNYIKRTIKHINSNEPTEVQLVLGYHDKEQLNKAYNKMLRYFNNVNKLSLVLHKNQYYYDVSQTIDESIIIDNYVKSDENPYGLKFL